MISKAGREMGSEAAAALSVAPMRRLNPYNGLGLPFNTTRQGTI